MNQQVKNLFLFCLLLVMSRRAHANQPDDANLHRYYMNHVMDYERGLVFKSLKQLQDSVALMNSNLFSRPIHKPTLYRDLYSSLKRPTKHFGKRLDDKPANNAPPLQIIQQMNKEIIKNQLVAYEQFFKKLKHYDDPMESRQAMNLIRTLFRFPVLLLFSNIFQLPLLPTLILASPFLNTPDGSPTALGNSISKAPLSTAMSNAMNSALQMSGAGGLTASAGGSANQMQTASSQQIASHIPFSLNPLVPINQLLNNFINEVIGDLQNTPIFNTLMQGMNQMLVRPNRLPMPAQAQNPLTQQQPASQPPTPSQLMVSTAAQLLNNQTKPINASDADLLSANASTLSFAYQEPPPSEPLPNIPLIGPVPDENGNMPGANILTTLANTLLESNKNFQLTESLGVNNMGSISDLAMNAVNTLATMLKIKKQKKELDSNEDMLLEFLTNKNYLEKVTSIGNLLKMGLKQKVQKEMNVCLVRTICESNQKQIGFAFDQIFSLAMHLTGMENRIEKSPYHMYYQIGRKMINEKNICQLIPKCRDEDEGDGKSLAEKKLELMEKIERFKKLENLLSRRRDNRLPDYQKPFRIMKKARKIRFAKRLFNRSFRKADKFTRRMSKLFF